MNFVHPILMAGSDVGGGSAIAQLGFFGLIFLMMYLLLIRPQKKKQKEHEELLANLKKGDKIVTSSGMFGIIFAMDEEKNTVVLKMGEIKLEFLRSSIAAKVEK
ncbi:MAG TPA: preprotein translocase subunit YajC [candidate division Zixibacteria bacterium]|nr:preprotein translocase subunit YajC [candidate division Zixibacteria bacterium]